ncbi:glycosyltransferase [Ornithinicoccus hortensis]|uniref:UDP:flavonoid glycosyltransferase YjiC (YdhE family) n=1 Tax=Ornithinicoccus hortensis TaxID=82346 RepID=A0A542YN12_9MICO|nr:glycosyltransferase [Ornithinicoccus hortensis]TQL49488.1 UDP:flavonoid glycosyltransferase YjiC (YdhE family) [Ornithinicoccus hortensis]
MNRRSPSVQVLAMGSRGDVQPFVALGIALAAGGLDVGITVPQDLAPTAAAHGLRTSTFPVDIRQASGEGTGLDWQADGSRGLRQEGKLLGALLAELAEPISEGVLAAGDADLVISGAMTYEAASIATRARGQRHIVGMLSPTTPGRKGSSTVYSVIPGAASTLNKATSMAMAAGAYSLFRQTADPVRARLGLPAGSFRDYLRTAYATPAMLACSPAIVPPDPAWGPQLKPTGAWFLPPDDSWVPPAELVDFLEAGEPPIYLGFGSMMSRDPRATTEIMLEALARTGRRGLIHSGWTGLATGDLPDTVALVGDVPHEWLFPRMSAVVHHGGAGTTAAAVRAGVPQLVVPHVVDQPYWGRRVAQLGIGPEPIKRHELDARRLAAGIERMITDPSVRTLAADLGAIVRREDGVATAVAMVRNYLGMGG